MRFQSGEVQSDFITENFQFGFMCAPSMIHIHTPPLAFHCGNSSKMVEAGGRDPNDVLVTSDIEK